MDIIAQKENGGGVKNAIVATFSIAVTAITTNVSAQNMTEGNMTEGNMTEGNMTGAGQISGERGGVEGTDISGGCIGACQD